jgi:hypothetical protein
MSGLQDESGYVSVVRFSFWVGGENTNLMVRFQNVRVSLTCSMIITPLERLLRGFTSQATGVVVTSLLLILIINTPSTSM